MKRRMRRFTLAGAGLLLLPLHAAGAGATIPNTGDAGVPVWVYVVLGIALVGIVTVLILRYKKRP